jgi:hypothetical protein
MAMFAGPDNLTYFQRGTEGKKEDEGKAKWG